MTFENRVPPLVFSHGGAGCCRVLEHKLDEEDVQWEGQPACNAGTRTKRKRLLCGE